MKFGKRRCKIASYNGYALNRNPKSGFIYVEFDDPNIKDGWFDPTSITYLD